MFIYAPVHTPDAPSPLDVPEAVVDYTCEGHRDGKFADGVDDGGEDHASCEVCGREDTDGDFIAGGLEGALDCELSLDGDGVGEGGEGIAVKEIVDVAEAAVGGCGDVAGEEV